VKNLLKIADDLFHLFVSPNIPGFGYFLQVMASTQ